MTLHRRRRPAPHRGIAATVFRARILIPATIVAIALVVGITPTASQVYAADVFGSLRAPGEPAFIAGHRGDRGVAPENTMPAFEAAFANPALRFVETDVQLTSDSVPVLFHDVTLERVAGVPGRVSDYTYKGLRRLDAGAWFGLRFAGERIPTLEEFLDRLKQTDRFALVELKFIWSADEVRRVVELIDERSLGSRVVLEAFSLETLANIQVVAPQLPRLMLARELPSDPVPMAKRLGVLAIASTAKAVAAAPEAVARLHAADLGVLCYTLNSEETWAEASALGVDGIITDVPSELDAWLAASSRGT